MVEATGDPDNINHSGQFLLVDGAGRVRGIYDRLLSSGRTTEVKVKQRLDALDTSTDFASLAAVDLVVEAVFEDIDIKRDVLRRLDETLRPDAIIGSNTSYCCSSWPSSAARIP